MHATRTSFFSSMPSRVRLLAAALAGAASLVGCADRTATGISKAPSGLLSSIHLGPHAVTLAVGDTLTLNVTALDLGGDTIAAPAGVRFGSQSATNATISSTGLVTAVKAADGPIKVAAALQIGTTTAVDTVTVFITPTRETPQRLVLVPDSFDGTDIGIAYGTYVDGFIVTATNDTLYVPITFTTSKPISSSVSTYQYFSSTGFGRVVVYGMANVYGTTYTDSLVYNVGYPIYESQSWSTDHWDYPSNLSLTLRPGGQVTWYSFGSTPSVDITFDDPTAASAVDGGASGNIPSFSGRSETRQFNTPGTYKWHSGTQVGTIRVMTSAAPAGS